MGMTPAEVQALMGDDIAAIELQLINSSIHTCQPEHLPGLLMSTDPMISLISLEPRILLIENFMSAADCQVCFLAFHSGKGLPAQADVVAVNADQAM